ncbi:MAG: hypothetical protein NW223_10280 [Hyphomicrobiaceae bacterium]|nr:hypothetical protein [Hyphomicrobiaceae bacterium]
MRALRLLLAGLGFAAVAMSATTASAGGWDHDYGYDYGRRAVYHDVYLPPRYVHIYRVHQPAPRYVHVIGYEQASYAAFRYARPYNYGHYWAAPYYRNYYPVRAVYPKARAYRHRNMK